MAVLNVRKYGDEFVVVLRPERLGIYMQGGPGIERALSEFGSYVEDLAAMLIEEEHRLGPGPQEQLEALRRAGFAPARKEAP